jgi:hypothetical protein
VKRKRKSKSNKARSYARRRGGYWLPLAVSTDYKDGKPPTDKEIIRTIKTRKIQRTQVLTVSVPQGIVEKITIPRGVTLEEWQSIFMGAFEIIATRLRAREIDPERIKEDFELTFGSHAFAGKSYAEMRRAAQYKMGSPKAFSRRVKSMRANARQRQLVNDRTDRFISRNYTVLVDVKNSKYKLGSPGLRALPPKKVFELMKDEGVLLGPRQHYNSAWCLWYKQRRKRVIGDRRFWPPMP